MTGTDYSQPPCQVSDSPGNYELVLPNVDEAPNYGDNVINIIHYLPEGKGIEKVLLPASPIYLVSIH